MVQVIAPYERARNITRRRAASRLLRADAAHAWALGMRRLKARVANHGAAIREDDGRVVPVSARWIVEVLEYGLLHGGKSSPRFRARFFQRYAAGEVLRWRLVLSRKMVTFLQHARRPAAA